MSQDYLRDTISVRAMCCWRNHSCLRKLTHLAQAPAAIGILNHSAFTDPQAISINHRLVQGHRRTHDHKQSQDQGDLTAVDVTLDCPKSSLLLDLSSLHYAKSTTSAAADAGTGARRTTRAAAHRAAACGTTGARSKEFVPGGKIRDAQLRAKQVGIK